MSPRCAISEPSIASAVLAGPCEALITSLRERRARRCGKRPTKWVRGKWRCEYHRRQGR